MRELLHAILLEAGFTASWFQLANAETWKMINDNDGILMDAAFFRRAYLTRSHDRDGTMLLEIVALEDARKRIEQWTEDNKRIPLEEAKRRMEQWLTQARSA